MTQVQAQYSSDRELLDLADRWINAWNTRDLNGVLDLYDAHAEHTSVQVFQWFNRPSAVGREQIEETFSHGFSGTTDMRLELMDTVLQPELGKAIILYRIHVNGERFHAAQVWRVQNGRIMHGEVFLGIRE